MANGNGTNKPKVEIGLNETATLKLLKDKPYSGENSFGAYYLYSVSHDGAEKAFFTSPDLHQKIAEAGLKSGDEFRISKIAVQNGRKVTARLDFEVVAKAPASAEKLANDGLKVLMERCVQEAVDITKSITGVSWQNEDVQKIASCLFIARSRG